MNLDGHEPHPKPLPRPSYAPALLAAGLMCVAWGAVTSWIVSVIGLVASAIASTRWIRDLRHG